MSAATMAKPPNLDLLPVMSAAIRLLSNLHEMAELAASTKPLSFVNLQLTIANTRDCANFITEWCNNIDQHITKHLSA